MPVASKVPVAYYGACEIAWHRCERPVVAVCEVVPAADIVPVFPSIVHMPALYRDHYCSNVRSNGDWGGGRTASP